MLVNPTSRAPRKTIPGNLAAITQRKKKNTYIYIFQKYRETQTYGITSTPFLCGVIPHLPEPQRECAGPGGARREEKGQFGLWGELGGLEAVRFEF